jgi:hypothetical protein
MGGGDGHGGATGAMAYDGLGDGGDGQGGATGAMA